MFRYTEVPSYRGFTVIFNYQFIKIAYEQCCKNECALHTAPGSQDFDLHIGLE
jgi:hypothetical protein